MGENMTDISVPIEIINKNMTDRYVYLEKEHQKLDRELSELSKKQSALFEILKGIIHPHNKYHQAYTYSYEYFKGRKAWTDALIMQEAVNQVVEHEGIIQEANARFVEVREQLKEIYSACGIYKSI